MFPKIRQVTPDTKHQLRWSNKAPNPPTYESSIFSSGGLNQEGVTPYKPKSFCYHLVETIERQKFEQMQHEKNLVYKKYALESLILKAIIKNISSSGADTEYENLQNELNQVNSEIKSRKERGI